ncbi:xylulokinase [Rhodoferax sp.]|uniref:xylulokinase n=1 Tax=Rhodoferax sp. TaxID=50421 RepID=UPI0025E5B967|nr:xylulokinase [Rhodoferax sp.]MCM2341428.1 xylulokinase [Rhodoferax sp.]
MYLGIDLGTSGLKLLLLDAAHHVHASVDAPLSLQRPHPTWSEQQPRDWWLALESAVAQLRAAAPHAWQQIRAIGLSGQMHGAVVLDHQSNVLRPAILWNDGRAEAQCTELERLVPNSRQITGNLAMPGFTAPKLLWLREHEPAVFEQISKVLLPKDWLRLQLTGESVSEMSDASGTLWLDVGQRCWSETMLTACGLDLSHMPRLVEGSQPSGTLLPTLARQWGLPQHVMVAGGGGDNAASAVGIGAVNPGQGFVSLGTSGVVFLVSDRYQPAPELAVHAFAHALPGRWHQMSVMLSAASAFGWVTRLTGTADEAQLSQQVADLSQSRRAAAPIFLPYLSGERTPHNNPKASGVFIGLRSDHTAADLGYAVMEGVSFGLMDGLRAMGQSGPSAQPLALVGGGARSDAWAQLLASGLGCPLQRCEGAHTAAALGAARLAWLADGGSVDQVCQSLPTERAFEPDTASAQLLSGRYPRYRALYPALTHLF